MQKTKTGFTPSHRYTQKGIYVAKVTVSEIGTGNVVAMGRKMINIDATETGAVTLAARQPRVGQPPKTTIAVSAMTGKFFFQSTKTDMVKYTGSFAMPAGVNLKQSNPLSFGIGNVIIDMTVDETGKVTPTNSTSHVSNNPFFSKLSLKIANAPKNGITLGGEVATFTTTVSTVALSLAGFDTEGITNTPTRDNSTGRRIQVSYNYAGVAYEDSANVTYALSPGGDFGAFGLQR